MILEGEFFWKLSCCFSYITYNDDCGNMVPLTIFYVQNVASRGKEMPVGAPKAKVGTAPDLDYTDIPHTQIRKVRLL